MASSTSRKNAETPKAERVGSKVEEVRSASAPSCSYFADWGEETLTHIRHMFSFGHEGLLAEEVHHDEKEGRKPAFMWSCGVYLSALAAAAACDPGRYRAPLRSFIELLSGYWCGKDEVWGYDVLPNQKIPDRYYDDNAWIVLGLLESDSLAKDTLLRVRAENTLKFVMSGEDAQLGGGIYWWERQKHSKNTCSNAPAIVAALRLFRITEREDYLETATRLYSWINRNLQDHDGLYFDNILLNGMVERTKWSYNSALMIRANCLFYAITRKQAYLGEAERIAQAAERQWVNSENGSISDPACFAHLLCEAFLFLSEQDCDLHWMGLAQRAAGYVHAEAQDPNGHYGRRWDMGSRHALDSVRLIDQASAARAYWMNALMHRRNRGKMK